VVIETMGDAYPILRERREVILGTIIREEAAFARTLDAGTAQLEEALIPLTGAERVIGRRPETLPEDAPVLAGDLAFRLNDTYGFPVDLTVELAAEYGVRVDREGFEAALEEQRQRSRSGRKADLARQAELTQLYDDIARATGETTFLGYETTTAEGRVAAIVRDGTSYQELEARPEAELRVEAGAAAELVLDRTPFYAERGGQVGDQGEIRDLATDELLFTVEDTQRPVGGLIVHRGTLHGRIAVGQQVRAVVEPVRRARTMRNHTGTHLLHRAIRNVVGAGAKQAGSLVAPGYLRFDYPLDRALTADERRAIEAEVRAVVREDLPVTVRYMPYQEAIEGGADAFFDEKYTETVRTVRVEGYPSFELCGGTHCRASGQIGGFVITSDRSIGSGMRRIEALTGDAADAWFEAHRETVEDAAERAGAQTPNSLPGRIDELQTRIKDLEKRLRAGAAGGVPKPADTAKGAAVIDGVPVVTLAAPFAGMDELKAYAKDVRGALGSGIIALVLDDDAPQVWVTVSDDLVARSHSAADLVAAAMVPLLGRGGGRPAMAQGKGQRRDAIAAALEAIRARVAG
jgi:alanyl-tRNA synthetase